MFVNYLHFILCLNFFFKAKTSFNLLNGTISKSNYLNVCSSIIKDNIECDVNKRFNKKYFLKITLLIKLVFQKIKGLEALMAHVTI